MENDRNNARRSLHHTTRINTTNRAGQHVAYVRHVSIRAGGSHSIHSLDLDGPSAKGKLSCGPLLGWGQYLAQHCKTGIKKKKGKRTARRGASSLPFPSLLSGENASWHNMPTRHCIQVYMREEKRQKTVNSNMPQRKTQCTLLRLGRVLRLTRPLAPRRWEKRDAVGMRHLCSCGTTGKMKRESAKKKKKKKNGEGERSTRKRAKVSWSFFVSVFRSQPAAVLLCFPPLLSFLAFVFFLESTLPLAAS